MLDARYEVAMIKDVAIEMTLKDINRLFRLPNSPVRDDSIMLLMDALITYLDSRQDS